VLNIDSFRTAFPCPPLHFPRSITQKRRSTPCVEFDIPEFFCARHSLCEVCSNAGSRWLEVTWANAALVAKRILVATSVMADIGSGWPIFGR
jgi:hypothetical protein